MNPIHLQTLLAIVDEGSFEIAAAVLGVSPSAVSQRIKVLEKNVGRVLLRRTSPVTATEAGEVLVQSARQMALLQAETEAQLKGRLGKVPLSVGVNADSLSSWFRPVLADIAQWEHATLHLYLEDESQTMSLLRRGDVLGAVTSEAEPVSGCEAMHLGAMRYYAVANPALLDRYTFDGEVDWHNIPTLRFGPGDALQESSVADRIGQGVRSTRVSQVPSTDGFMEAARVGLGWAMLPESQARQLIDSGDVVHLDNSVMEVPLYWHRWRLQSEALDRLSDAVIRAAEVLQH